MKNKTALEEFAIALYEGGYLQGNGDEIQKLLEQHLEMEKERIEKDYMSGYSNGGLDTCITPQQYYEHIYGGTK
jgi:hypothetical protein